MSVHLIFHARRPFERNIRAALPSSNADGGETACNNTAVARHAVAKSAVHE